MNESRLPPLFGLALDPAAADPQEPLRRARLADEQGLDLVTLMDHPYNAGLLENWTLLTALATSTQRVHVGTNVLNLPLRPPAMIAKMAATLDVLSGGRLELGLGAGGYWDGVAAFGGPRRAPGEAYRAFREALIVIRGLWDNAGRSFTHEGEFYRVKGARFGPAPAHRIRIWTGAVGPKMQRLTGEMADGLLISYNYVGPERLQEVNRRIDEGAAAAGRSPTEIRRGYNLMGVLQTGHPDNHVPGLKENYINGPAAEWVEKMVQWYEEYRQDTFNFWPVAGDQYSQMEAFAQEVVPAVKAALG